ncbi:DUF6173 family protein [Rhizobium laguerreae]|uniref:DUF6173 family protein n=1 Tax=Rhizobium laguerreae TaxID=1076926 RepID=UPI001A8FDAF8|nr:DUF6173 family protein [Rhizobium laguerreae]MBN9983100.1 hypothetical protein [Rhizobium laguerreae]MBY3127397.1 hypothetical protein [Rhizobium laguerreae]MBY3250181.1 hypothetical protein [Rhizobium laguerreae]
MRDLASQITASFEEVAAIERRKNNPSGYIHERMMQIIAEQEQLLSAEQELGVAVVGGNAPSFHLRSIGYSNPDLLRFVGTDPDGNTVQIVQHHTQMSIMIVSVPKLGEKAFRVGFVPSNHEN